jgi:hypothetical protein
MSTKTAKTELMQAREAQIAALDAKLGNMPEWKVFLHLDRAIFALDADQPPPPKIPGEFQRLRVRLNKPLPSYMALAEKALKEIGKPITTLGMVDYISKHRPLSGDPEKARSVIQSSLSKDKRFASVPWEGRRAWWYLDKEVPK